MADCVNLVHFSKRFLQVNVFHSSKVILANRFFSFVQVSLNYNRLQKYCFSSLNASKLNNSISIRLSYPFGRIPRRPYSSIIRKASTGRRGSGFPGVRYRSRALLHSAMEHCSFLTVFPAPLRKPPSPSNPLRVPRSKASTNRKALTPL